MSKKIQMLLSILSAVMVGLITWAPAAVAEDDYAWVLVEIIDQDAADKIAAYNEKNKTYRLSGQYKPLDFTMTRTYIGPTSKSSGMRKGETATYRASFSAPPKVIRPGETIGTRLKFEAVKIDLDFFDFKGSARALRDGMNLENADGRHSFTLGKKQGYGTIEEVLTAKAPRGSAGKRMKLQFQLYTADTMRTIYVYEYRRIDTAAPELEPAPPNAGPAWVLAKIIHEDAADKIAAYNDKNKTYRLSGQYKPLDFTMARTYIGPTNQSSGMRKGETATYRASFTAPPKVIRPGETIGTRLTLDAVQIDLDFFDFKGSVRALRDGTNFENADGRYSFTLGKKQGYGTVEEVLTAKAPRGSEGKRMKLQFQLYTADTMRTIYIYEYR